VAGSETRTNFIGNLAQDLHDCVRILVTKPGFTIAAILALALGIGASSAIFSLTNAVLLRPLPFKDPDQLVMVWESASHLGFPKNPASPANYRDWKRQTTVFQSMVAMTPRGFDLTGAREPEKLEGRRVSVGFFDLLGVKPVIGRNFVQEEAHKVGTHVVLLSHGLWQRRYGADPGVVGQALTLNRENYTVIGVMSANVQLPGSANVSDELWVPIDFPKDEAASRESHYLEVIARMKPGVTLQQAQAEMDTITARLARAYPESNLRMGAVVVPLHKHFFREIKPASLLLFAAVGILFLFACAYASKRLLACAAVRPQEVIALRSAHDGSRSRLARQFLAGSILLALFGGAIGLLLGFQGINILNSFVPSSVSRAAAIGFDWRVVLFALLVSLLTSIVLGLMPAFHASRADLRGRPKTASRASTDGRQSATLPEQPCK
jgi:predicted permease